MNALSIALLAWNYQVVWTTLLLRRCILFFQIAMVAYLQDSSAGKEGLTFLSGAKVLYELYQRLTEKDNVIQVLRVSTLLDENLLFLRN